MPSRCNDPIDRRLGKKFSRYWIEHVLVRTLIQFEVVARPNVPHLGNSADAIKPDMMRAAMVKREHQACYLRKHVGTHGCRGGAMQVQVIMYQDPFIALFTSIQSGGSCNKHIEHSYFQYARYWTSWQ
jgi:hypothetical protein